jgi:hypothetical protein
MARLRHAGHEDSVLDGVSPPLRGLASDFGKTQSHQRSNPPLVRPPASGFLGSPVCPTARADGPSLAQRRSLGVLPRGLDKRAHLGEQQGATPNPQHRGQLTSVGCNKRSALHRANTSLPIRGKDRAGCYLAANPWPTPWREQIVAPMQQAAQISIGERFYIEGPIVSISP